MFNMFNMLNLCSQLLHLFNFSIFTLKPYTASSIASSLVSISFNVFKIFVPIILPLLVSLHCLFSILLLSSSGYKSRSQIFSLNFRPFVPFPTPLLPPMYTTLPLDIQLAPSLRLLKTHLWCFAFPPWCSMQYLWFYSCYLALSVVGTDSGAGCSPWLLGGLTRSLSPGKKD